MRYEQNFAVITRRMVTTIARDFEAAAEFVGAMCGYQRLPSLSWVPVQTVVCESILTGGRTGLSAHWHASTGNTSYRPARADSGPLEMPMHGVCLLRKHCPAIRSNQG